MKFNVKIKTMNKLNIGALIKAEMQRQGMSVAEMAKKLNVQRQTVYDMLKRTNIDVERLKDISDVLHKDFLSVIGSHVPSEVDWCDIIVTDKKIVITRK